MHALEFIEVTTTVGCSLACRYCPQHSIQRSYTSSTRSMSLETFRYCIGKVPSRIQIHFSGFAEPWLNSCTTDMLLYAYAAGHSIQVYSTLKGMTLADLRRLRIVKPFDLCIHLPDADGLMHLKPDADYLSVLDAVAAGDEQFTCDAHFVCIGTVHPTVATVMATHGHSVWHSPVISRAGNVDVRHFGAQRVPFKTGTIRCARNKIGRQPVLLPNGDLYLCCCDYGLRHRMGNLLTAASYMDIWDGPEFAAFCSLLTCDSSDLICRRCESGAITSSPTIPSAALPHGS